MTATAPDVMKTKKFKSRTTPKNIFTRGRKHIGIIDIALTDFHKNPRHGNARILQCREILDKCQKWLTDKGDKTSSNFLMRKLVVLELADQVFARMQWELFKRKKSLVRSGLRNFGAGRALTGGYVHERTTYLGSGKTKAVSGSSVSVLMDFNKDGQLGETRIVKTFSQLSQNEYVNIMNTLGREMGFGIGIQEEVKFMPKGERMKFMLVIERGLIFMGFNTRFDTTRLPSGFPYVIDEYGNWYSTDHARFEHTLSANSRFNHSSFNAGKDVISAGIVQVVNGSLTYIDNNSGHYKPTRQNIFNAVKLLDTSGIDMSGVKVGLKEYNNQLLKLQFHYYNSAQTFLNNINAIPDESYDAD